MSGASPELSVVFMIDGQRRRAVWAVHAVLEQRDVDLEVLLFDFGHTDHPPLAGSEDPRVRTIPSTRGAGYGDTLAAAAHAARAPIVAFVEEHVVVRPGWARAIRRAHDGPWAAVCGEVEPGDLSSPNSLRQELVSRNVWSTPARDGESILLRWQNVSYKRELLLGYGDRLPRLLDAEGTLFRQLRADGHRLAVAADAHMVHAHEESWLGFLVGSFHSNRLAAARGVEHAGGRIVDRLRGAVAAGIGPLRWPLVLLERTRALPDRETWLAVLRANLVHVLAYYAVTGAAGLAGALLGAGDSAVKFLEYELGEPRRTPERVELAAR
jgi:hypothetical protein